MPSAAPPMVDVHGSTATLLLPVLSTSSEASDVATAGTALRPTAVGTVEADIQARLTAMDWRIAGA